MSQPIVFIAQIPMKKNPDGVWVQKPIDLTKASDYGMLEVVWPPQASVAARADIEAEAMKIGRLYDPDKDYIIALGSPSLICAIAWAIGRCGKKLRMLEWQNRSKTYAPTMMDSFFKE
jgi:hypothetical protein